MSFGWSVGDVVAAGKLISEVINSLKDAGGASPDYQELIRELETLDRALKQADRLEGIEADGIKCAALSCRFILRDFLGSIEKYGKTLDVGSTSSRMTDAARKVQWQMVQKGEVKNLRRYVAAHVGTISMMLAHRAVQVATDTSEKAESNRMILSLKLDSVANSLVSAASTATEMLAFGRCMFQKVFDMVRTDVVESLGVLKDMASNTLIIIQQIHSTVLEIKGQLARVETRFTYFQAPFQVEDALGRVFPVPSEYDFGLLVCIIEHRFKDDSTPGHSLVQGGEYELFVGNDSTNRLGSNGKPLLPGIKIKMALRLPGVSPYQTNCPRDCGNSTQKAAGGGRTCPKCGVWFDERAFEAPHQLSTTDNVVSISTYSYLGTRQSFTLDEGKAFRNILVNTARMNCSQVVERYAIWRCVYYEHAIDPCPKYGQYGHAVEEKTVLVGYACNVHSNY